MHPIVRTHGAALISAALLIFSIAACSGGGSMAPMPSSPQQNPVPAASSAPPGSSPQDVITVSNSDRKAVASHGRTLTHYWRVQTHASGVKPQSIVHVSDLEYFGGAVLKTALNYNAYVNTVASAFGSVKQFEQSQSRSQFIHMTDFYVGSTASNRYDFGGDFRVTYPAVTTLGDNDLLLIIHAFASHVAGGGLNHIYNIFLANGQNYCATGTLLPNGLCNASPTSPNPAFCGFHGSVTFSDIGTTLFTVEPYIDTDFCGVDNMTAHPTAPTPRGLQLDSTYSALSHEIFETITDPNPGSGWVNPDVFYPSEIGDLCAYVNGPFSNGFVVPQNTNLNGTVYRLQFEYSNRQHGCNNTPP